LQSLPHETGIVFAKLQIHKSEHGFTQPILRGDLIPNRGNFDFSSRPAFESVGKIRKIARPFQRHKPVLIELRAGNRAVNILRARGSGAANTTSVNSCILLLN
jgi:hypothetical protein